MANILGNHDSELTADERAPTNGYGEVVVGFTRGSVRVLAENGINRKRDRLWLVECLGCGGQRTIPTDKARRGQACRECAMRIAKANSDAIVTIGASFLGQVVIADLGRRSGHRTVRVRCECGKERTTKFPVTHRCQSCLQRKHRIGWNTPTYKTWTSMIQRCTNPNNDAYPTYGGRGITVCDRWRVFANFADDMGEKRDGMSLDRIDPNGNYEPANCRWLPMREQARNTRHAVSVDLARDIKKRYAEGETVPSIADTTKLSRRTIRDIVNGRHWTG